MAHLEEKIAGRTIFEGKIIDLLVDEVKLENGKTAKREVVVHHGGACILAVNDAGQVAMVRQFRYPAGKELLELPAGKLEKGEDPLEAAAREMIEETGYRALDIIRFGEIMPTCAYCTEIIYIHKATKLEKAAQNLDADEFLDVLWLDFNDALNMVLSGEITDAKTCYAILKESVLRNK